VPVAPPPQAKSERVIAAIAAVWNVACAFMAPREGSGSATKVAGHLWHLLHRSTTFQQCAAEADIEEVANDE